jgi:hypothetical protein
MKDSCKQPRWAKKDLREFDRLVTKMDSQDQMQRIEGRLDWPKFRDRFTKEELDEMWEFIK